MRRLAIVLALVVLVPVLALVAALGFRQRVGDLEERLVRDANATFTAPRPRPTHAPARPGTFGDAVARHLPAIQQVADARKDDDEGRELVRAIVAGDRPLADLPAAWREDLHRLRPALEGLLEGTHAERADLPPAGDDALRPAPGTDWGGYQFAALLAGIEARKAIEAGDQTRATGRCLDGLGLARDASVSRMLIGRMVGVAITARLTPPCADVLAMLPVEERRRAAAAVRTIAAAFPPIDETFREDFLSIEVHTFGHVMSESAMARLDPAARHHLEESKEQGLWRLLERLVLRDTWRNSRRMMDAQVQAFALPAGPRELALAAALDVARRDPNPIAYTNAPDFSTYARRADAAALRLDALLLVASALDHLEATGAWPARVEDLAGPLGEAAPRLAPATALAARGEALEITVALPRGKDDDAGDLVLRVAPPARGRGAPR